MNKLRCIVVDDEGIARKAIKAYIEKVDGLQFIKEFRNGLEAKSWLASNEVDLIFLDINMPYLSGLEMLKLLAWQPQVIFTTAHAEHAIESFEFNVVDYLLKPISFDRFLQAVTKAKTFYNLKIAHENATLTIKVDGNFIKIEIANILYVEAMQNYVKIATTREKHIVLMSLKKILEELPEEEFVQTHRSFLVQLSKIKRIEKNEIVVGEDRIPVSKRSKKEILDKFKG